MNLLGRAGQHPEGRFFPDTYTYAKGSSDVAVLQARPARHGQAAGGRLGPALAARRSLKTPDEALILASIVEKETGKAADRTMIAAVFNNRLRVGMPLQTDPTVIYGMGAAFDGNLRKKDLQTDTPWNTYTRAGLPPTPDRHAGQGLAAGGGAAGAEQGAVLRRRAATAPASSAPTWTSTTARSTSTSAGNERRCKRPVSSASKASTAPASPATSRRWPRRSARRAAR